MTVLSVATTSANLIDYFRLPGSPELRSRCAKCRCRTVPRPTAALVTTFGLKPKSDLTFQSAQAPVRTIAHWEAAPQRPDDVPQLQSVINSELFLRPGS